MRYWWLILLLLFLLTPIFFFIGVAAEAPEGSLLQGLLWLYPAFCIADAICAWICYPQRKEITWILIGILILSHIGVYILHTETL
ncbi:MAG: hypothetical protein NC102_03600 [Clostridium sp.]|nr:hypothetical protein [Clostridium sp.]